LKSSNEVIGITTPELPALTDLLKSIRLVEEYQKEYLGSVINMVKNKKYEPKKDSIITLLGEVPILEIIPHDEHVKYALAKRMPVVHHKPNSKASLKIKSLAAKLEGKEFKIPWYRKLFI
jgi:MinD-like ATPase involved in chromosome partitioning or flagellar assembly